MTINLSLAIFLLGTATGTLLKRLGWTAVKQEVPQESWKQLWAGRSADRRPPESAHPDATTLMATSGGHLQPAPPAPLVGEAMAWGVIADRTLRTLLDQKQMEIARLRREIQTLRVVIPRLEDDFVGIERCDHGDRRDQIPILQIRYVLGLSPRRTR